MADENQHSDLKPGSEQLVNKLVEEHIGWASSIARSVARAWNLDWQLDGLDGGAYEGLMFCARRFDPSMGVPFRAYARRRIHESSTDEARKSKSWKRGVGADTQAEQDAREISARLFQVFPELRNGLLPAGTEKTEDSTMRLSVRQLLASASMLASLSDLGGHDTERVFEYKQMLEVIADLEPVHQAIVWAMYYRGQSMRALAEEWGIDELNVIREHKEILGYMFSRLANLHKTIKKLKVRPGLRAQALEMKRKKALPPFARFLGTKAILFLFNCYSFSDSWSPFNG